MSSKLLSAYIYGLFIFLMVLALFIAGAFTIPVWIFGGDPRWSFQVVVRFFWRLFLKMSPEERLRANDNASRAILELRNAYKQQKNYRRGSKLNT